MPKGVEHLSEADKHVAALAISRFGVARARLEQVFPCFVQAKLRGQSPDLLTTLVMQRLLTPAQAEELRLAMATTNLDADQIEVKKGVPPKVNGADAVTIVPPGSVYDLRQLGEYHILRPLGEGGMGSVYLGYHEGQGRQFAIKVLPEHLATNAGYVQRFYREARNASQLDHPNIVRFIAAGRDKAADKHYMVLEYVDGPSAHALLQQYGKLQVGDAVHVILDIAKALEHAHSKNIVHRDIKPDNILLTRSGMAKLSDLGLAKQLDDATQLTGARQGFGTPYYMPYEQALNAKDADARSDIYALGATFYHLLTGEIPFPGSSHLEIAEKKNLGLYTPASINTPAVPPALDAILDRMLARDPHERYQSASQLIVDIERSGLAAAVPSFVNLDDALQDPVMRARLIAPAEPTRPDLDAPSSGTAKGLQINPNQWYLRYRNGKGGWTKTRATTQQIVQRLREGKLSPADEASAEAKGKYRPLAEHPDFRDAAVPSGPARRLNTPQPRKSRPIPPVEAPRQLSRPVWWMLAGLGMLAILVALVVIFVR
jgi:serine/threonine-protein kinase